MYTGDIATNKNMADPRGDYLTRFQPKSDIPKAKSPISLRLRADIDEVLRSQPNWREWVESLIIEGLKAEGKYPK